MEIKNRFLLAAMLSAACLSVHATPVVYSASDNNVTSLAQMVNSSAMAANFDSVAGAISIVDFESALPANVTISGGTTTNNSGCGALCGFNTSAGGAYFRSVSGGAVTFSFASAVDSFGFYVNGLQTNLVPQQTIVYTDGSSITTTLNIPPAINGGGAFFGFIDFGSQISSVTFNATNDVLGFDDLRFGRSQNNPNPVPEPGAFALFGFGLIGVWMAVKRRATDQARSTYQV